MDKNIDLWHVYKAETNSPTDIWKEKDLIKHPNLEPSLLGTPKKRYTVPILLLGKLGNGDQVLLMLQTSTAHMKFEEFIIRSEAFTKDLGVTIEHIYSINIRIGLASELFRDSSYRLLSYGEIKESLKTDIFKSTINLMSETPRIRTINRILYGEYSHLTQKEWNHLVIKDQFSYKEKVFKGLVKEKGKK